MDYSGIDDDPAGAAQALQQGAPMFDLVEGVSIAQ